jgi:hypothetical protein
MRAVKVRCGVVRLLYVRHKSHAVGNPTVMFFGRHSAAQFVAETLAVAFGFLGVAAKAIADLFIALSTRFGSKLNDKLATHTQASAEAGKVRVA